MYKLVNGIQSDKMRDTLLRKGADLTLKKAIDVCRADETTNHEMKTIKQKIGVDAVQRNRRRSNNDNRGKIQHTARAATSTTTNNQRNANTVESNTCRSNVQHLVKHAENVGKRIPGQTVAMQE